MNRLTNTHQNGYYWAMSPSNFNINIGISSGHVQNETGFTAGAWTSHDDGLRPVSKM